MAFRAGLKCDRNSVGDSLCESAERLKKIVRSLSLCSLRGLYCYLTARQRSIFVFDVRCRESRLITVLIHELGHVLAARPRRQL